ncbi:MAG: TlpA family protein disulfide reductase [Hyphomicrobiaceae bacterium]
MSIDYGAPPELQTIGWLGTDEPLTLAGEKGKVVALLAFQMLCPGCVARALPQAQRLRERFAPEDLTVIGLHTVFEHHAVMTPAALAAFLHENRLGFPVGIDRPDGEDIPHTMAAYEMRGTPTMLIFDRAGRLRRHYFGQPDDMVLGAEIAAMIVEENPRVTEARLGRALVQPGHRHGDGEGDGHEHHHHHGDGCGCGHDH